METQPWQSPAVPHIPLAEVLLLIFISFLQLCVIRNLSKPSEPRTRADEHSPGCMSCSNGNQWLNQANLEGFCKPGSQEFGGSALSSRNSWVTDTTQAG